MFDGLNRRYIYNLVPLFHTLIFLVEMAVTLRLMSKFNSYYADRPVLTTMVTNSVLGGVADTVAQTITIIRMRLELSRHGTERRSNFISVELHDGDKERSPSRSDMGHRNKGVPTFDFERLTRFMFYGFIMAPIQHKWFGLLSRVFPIDKGSHLGPAFKRMFVDQLLFAPFGLVSFFTFMTLAEGGGRRMLAHKLRDVYIPTLKANYALWPTVQAINFAIVPIQFQIPFVSSVGIAWTAFLSLTNSAEEQSH